MTDFGDGVQDNGEGIEHNDRHQTEVDVQAQPTSSTGRELKGIVNSFAESHGKYSFSTKIARSCIRYCLFDERWREVAPRAAYS